MRASELTLSLGAAFSSEADGERKRSKALLWLCCSDVVFTMILMENNISLRSTTPFLRSALILQLPIWCAGPNQQGSGVLIPVRWMRVSVGVWSDRDEGLPCEARCVTTNRPLRKQVFVVMLEVISVYIHSWAHGFSRGERIAQKTSLPAEPLNWSEM